MWEDRLREALAVHDYNLTHDPARAHWNAALAGTAVGLLMSGARGAVTALMQPSPLRWQCFFLVSRGVAPLYVIPFVLGTQLDCYQTCWERRGVARPPMSHVASELG